ncbi:MAG: [protein-PII] uridylyltransferase [Proteobacteria bacterium]|nr:[protein-PII] uridylyltransferase [Pseudomonadota bacterium]
MTASPAALDLDGVMDDADFAPLEALLGAAPDQRARDCCRAFNATLNARLEARFRADRDAELSVRLRSWAISRQLVLTWRLFGLGDSAHALAAVGGFGRGELHPCSDVDIAVILGGPLRDDDRERLERWLTFLWDIGLEIGTSVRSVDECAEEAERDVTVVTNLMEARLLTGAAAPFAAMRAVTGPDRLWPAERFFGAKLAEQRARHRKYDDAFGQLEPNVKDGPGGLRDIQNISWVANRHFRAAGLAGLVTHGFLSADEYTTLRQGRRFLWQVRCALHFVARRREDRLLFDHQRSVADMLGYRAEGHHGIEQFMRHFYRTVRELASLNDMLLALFRDATLDPASEQAAQPLGRRFQIRNGYIEARDEHVFSRNPRALLEVFLLMQQHPHIEGVRASTIRLIRQHLHHINDKFRADIRARSLFLEIIRQPRRIGHELERMHRYGVLAAYLPVFARVTGLMQFDLFHVYTVDEHTLRLVRNLRRFSHPSDHDNLPPHCAEAVARVPKLEILYIGGLFHDIAKGRHGDHSDLGAEDAVRFCRDHGFSNYDTHLVAWLVRNHLLMSATAQRKDIYDPAVIADFARKVGDLVHLDYLYLLTVADIGATNPALWTPWKASLLGELFSATRRHLRSGNETPLARQERLEALRHEARACLGRRQTHIPAGRLERFWAGLAPDYFLRHRPEEIAWHAEVVTDAAPTDAPLVAVRDMPERGCTAVFVYCADMDKLFAITTAALDRLRLDIQDARVITTDAGYSIDTYMVLDADSGSAVDSAARRAEIGERVRRALLARERPPASATVASLRRHRHFNFTPVVQFARDDKHSRTVMEVIAVDRPGLLSAIGDAMDQCGVSLVDARIATFGERAEDYFYITDRRQRPFSDPLAQARLRDLIVTALT